MAQGKVVDYQLLKEAGYAAHMEKPRAEKGFFTEFLDMGKKYLDHTKQKTDELVASMPEIDIAKVDEKMLPMTNSFLSEQRDIIVQASSDMAFYGSNSKKGKEAVNKYNMASAAIVNFNKNLTHLQEEIKYAFENPAVGNEVSVFDAADHHDFANKTVYDKISKIDQSGNIYWNSNGVTKIDDGLGNSVDIPIGEQKILDRKRSKAYDATSGGTWQQFITGVRGLKTRENKDWDLSEVGGVNLAQIGSFAQSLKREGGIVGFMYNESSQSGQTYIEKFITNSIEEGGLGVDKGLDPDLYEQLFHDLKDGNWDYEDENGDIQKGDMSSNLETFLRDDAQDAWDGITKFAKEKVVETDTQRETRVTKSKIKEIIDQANNHEEINIKSDPDLVSDADSRASLTSGAPMKYEWKTSGSTVTYSDGREATLNESGYYLMYQGIRTFKKGHKEYGDYPNNKAKRWFYGEDTQVPTFKTSDELLTYMYRNSDDWQGFTKKDLGLN